METTLRKIQDQKLHRTGWLQLLSQLGKKQADDEPVAIATILTVNGLGYAAACLEEVEGFEKEIKRFNLECAKDVRHLMIPACRNLLVTAESDFNGSKPISEIDFTKIYAVAEHEAWKVKDQCKRFADYAVLTATCRVNNLSKVTEEVVKAAANAAFYSHHDTHKCAAAMNDIQQRQVDRLKALCAGEEIATDGLEWKVPKTDYGVYRYDEAMSMFGKPDANGWRLPTVEECLEYINSFIDKKARKQEPFGCFWTSSIPASVGLETCNATYVNFRRGDAQSDYKTSDYRIRLVRKLK